MGSFGRTKLSLIWKMLDGCAAGHSRKLLKHSWCVMYRSKTYPWLPKGSHGERDPEIEIGHVKKMIRHLEVDLECARKRIEGL